MNAFIQFLHMGGYGLYVWSAYGSVIVFMLVQGLRPWVRWHRYLEKLKHYLQNNEQV